MKVEWEKELRPNIKEQYDFEKLLMDKKLKLVGFFKMMHEKTLINEFCDGDEGIPYRVMNEEDKAKTQKMIDEYGKEKVEKLFIDQWEASVKEDLARFEKDAAMRKSAVFVWAHLYNGNVEQAIPYFHKYKDKLFVLIEDPEKSKLLTIYEDGAGSNRRTLHNEGAYLELCKNTKDLITWIERIIAFLSNYGTAIEVLKAGKKMNKRKGKKNRR
tara:strand:- start:534 stop:1175 length:642 start_codon:yes stop_codon:yes gene_type:complete